MEEAERLCDRVAIIEHGEVIEIDTPAALVKKHCPERGVVFSASLRDGGAGLRAIPGLDSLSEEEGSYRLDGRGDDFVSHVMRFLASRETQVHDFRTVTPTLEDVFLKLTGHGIRD
jgi:ABC-2 type transport system ATP-binding protein